MDILANNQLFFLEPFIGDVGAPLDGLDPLFYGRMCCEEFGPEGMVVEIEVGIGHAAAGHIPDVLRLSDFAKRPGDPIGVTRKLHSTCIR